MPTASDAAEVGLGALLAGDARFTLVGVTGVELASVARSLQPSLIVLDPQVDGELDLEQVRTVAGAAPKSNLCIYTGYFEAQSFLDSLRAGARGYLLKRRRSASSLLDFLSSVACGDLAVDAEVIDRLERNHTSRLLVTVVPTNPPLDDREELVLHELLNGRTEPEVAAAMDMSLRTVCRVVDKLRGEFHARNVRELVLKAAQSRLTP